MMSTLTTRVGPVVVTHTKRGENELTSIYDTQNPSMYLDVQGKSMDLSIRWAVDYVKLHYDSLVGKPLVGHRTTSG